jgi:histo-blood group ABO system transferase
MAKVGLCIIATNGYIDFVSPLLCSADEYFLIGHEVEYHVFSNKGVNKFAKNRVITHPISHQPWPAMTLLRYHIMSAVDLSGYDYVYYIDADMRFVAPVGDEIFGQLVAVQHPGYFRGGGGWETNRNSNAWMPECKRKNYIAGGFQGGSEYVKAFTHLRQMIDEDMAKGYIAKWHDESYWNRLKSISGGRFKFLDPSYCMVEEPEKRKLWGIDHLQPKIIALAKDHSQYQK